MSGLSGAERFTDTDSFLRAFWSTQPHKPHIYRAGGAWWVNCKHGDRTGPYRTRAIAFLAANRIAAP